MFFSKFWNIYQFNELHKKSIVFTNKSNNNYTLKSFESLNIKTSLWYVHIAMFNYLQNFLNPFSDISHVLNVSYDQYYCDAL